MEVNEQNLNTVREMCELHDGAISEVQGEYEAMEKKWRKWWMIFAAAWVLSFVAWLDTDLTTFRFLMWATAIGNVSSAITMIAASQSRTAIIKTHGRIFGKRTEFYRELNKWEATE